MTFTTRRAFSWPLCLICFFTTSTLATRSLSERSEQTQAKCNDDFNWATSSQGSTPCLLTAYVWGSCFNGNWNVLPLAQGEQYTNPNSTTANDCTCSWAAYNLISACTACQGFDSAVANWAAYSQSCGGFETNAYFPSNVTLPTGTAIPSWAGTNPRTWNNAHFDTAQAQLIAQEHKPDLVQGQTPPDAKKSKPPVGAIVGGVVGGVAVLVIGAGIAFWFIRKRNRDHVELANDTGAHPFIRPRIHGRSVSDDSGKSILTPQTMSIIQRPGTIYTTGGTIHTRTGSAHSLPYGSGYTSPVRVMSPPPTSQLLSREDVIEPFTLRSMSPPSPGMTRKPSETTMATTYNNHEVSVGAFIPSSEGSSERTRLNPPAYSPYVSPAPSPEPGERTPTGRADFAPGHRPRHEKGSVDTQQSSDSSPTHAARDSTVSGIDEVIGRMRLTMASESVAGAHTVSTGGSANVLSRPTHKSSVSNPDNETLG
ncbi:hypothetical protein B0H16DRAFT_1749079 [Mycena metata]|uniref:Uncharacterized protein n=1 Tax=Mycena metata TaxID=1033252 RepID=A0AAD7DUU2_9AGAR|nr:hypothetical protein B0H16DRAFT_1749079 [Mycena metata]